MDYREVKCSLKRSTKNSCGYDFIVDSDCEFEPNVWNDIDTKVCILGKTVYEEPSWTRWFMLVVPRSSLGMKYGFRFINTVGIIDQDFNGTIKARFMCDKKISLKKGDKLMQGIIMPYYIFNDEETPDKERDGGIGSTDGGRSYGR